MNDAIEPWFGTFEFVSDEENGHIEAMAGSDLGLSYDGQMIGQAIACHLPTLILLDMKMN